VNNMTHCYAACAPHRLQFNFDENIFFCRQNFRIINIMSPFHNLQELPQYGDFLSSWVNKWSFCNYFKYAAVTNLSLACLIHEYPNDNSTGVKW